jgi:ABC-2 type transport system ATP-binding protein
MPTSHSASTPVIETLALTRRYGDKLALDGLDLTIPRGRIHALVGANGAGKSTLFRILLGFLPPSAGSAAILGFDCGRLTPEARRRIGFVNEEHTLPPWMTVRALVRMQRRHYRDFDDALFAHVRAHYDVRDGQRIGELSRGERAGLNLALALAQGPELLILDEPTLGLDVVAKRAFLESLLQNHAGDRCTVLYCSHQMEEIERVADNLILLERGRLLAMAAPDDLVARVTHWVAEFPFRTLEAEALPGLLEARRIEGLEHLLVLDQGDSFADLLRTRGARAVSSMGVSLDRAVNAFLARGHAAPARTAA